MSTIAEARTGAILAHELRHAYQDDNGGRLGLQLRDVVEHVLSELHGPSIPGRAWNRIPYEIDANRAAARFLRRFYPEAIPLLLASDDPSLARATDPPAAPVNLQRLVVGFLWQEMQELDRPLRIATPYRSMTDWLEHCSPGAASIWHDLVRAAG